MSASESEPTVDSLTRENEELQSRLAAEVQRAKLQLEASEDAAASEISRLEAIIEEQNANLPADDAAARFQEMESELEEMKSSARELQMATVKAHREKMIQKREEAALRERIDELERMDAAQKKKIQELEEDLKEAQSSSRGGGEEETEEKELLKEELRNWQEVPLPL